MQQPLATEVTDQLFIARPIRFALLSDMDSRLSGD